MSNLSINKGVNVNSDVSFQGKKEKVSDNKPSNDEGMKTSTKLMLGATALATAVVGGMLLLKKPIMSKTQLTKYAKENSQKIEDLMNKKRNIPKTNNEDIYMWNDKTVQHIKQGNRSLKKIFNPDGTLHSVEYNNNATNKHVAICRKDDKKTIAFQDCLGSIGPKSKSNNKYLDIARDADNKIHFEATNVVIENASTTGRNSVKGII